MPRRMRSQQAEGVGQQRAVGRHGRLPKDERAAEHDTALVIMVVVYQNPDARRNRRVNLDS